MAGEPTLDGQRSAGTLVCFLFFISGASGLIYQVVWVRQFGNVFGNTVFSAAVVTAIFMSGLGVGSLCAGLLSDRMHRHGDFRAPLLWYGYAECAVGVLGLLLANLLPRLGELSAGVAHYEPGAHGWYELSSGSTILRYGAAVSLLAPSSLLMGGTLTLLVRHVVRGELSEAGFRIGVLYGANTLGAALGCLATDLFLIPAFGLLATQSLAVVGNLGAGVGAIHLATGRTLGAIDGQKSPMRTSDSAPDPTPDRGRVQVRLLALSLFLSGFAGMGFEILWFRHLSSILGAFRSVFSLLLATILIGIWLGSTGVGLLVRRTQRAALALGLAQLGLLFFTLLGLLQLEREDVSRHTFEVLAQYGTSAGVPALLLHWVNLRAVLLTVGIPAIFLGAAYPLANVLVQTAKQEVGGRAGSLYLGNTLGAVAGSLVTGFVLLPAFGVQRAVLVLASLLVVMLAPVAASTPPTPDQRRTRLALAAAAGLGVLLLLAWARLPADDLIRRTIPPAPGIRILTVSEGIAETIAVTEIEGVRTLRTNGHSMSGTSSAAQRYMRAFVHLPMLSMRRPKDALVICFGVGTTLNAATKHPTLERIEIVDISRHVLEHASYFRSSNENVLEDARVRVFINDGRQHLRMRQEASFDLITLEPPPLAFAGVANLYSREFYQLIRSRLRPEGIATQWLPAYQMNEAMNRSIVRAFVEVFPEAVLLSGQMAELILMGSPGGAPRLEMESIRDVLAENAALRADLNRVGLGTLTEIAGTFVASGPRLQAATEGALPVSDDFPIMEYAMISNYARTRLPEEFFALDEIGAWCPRCLEGGRSHELAPNLQTYLQILQMFYRSEDFLIFDKIPMSRPEGGSNFKLPANPEVKATIEASVYLQRLFTERSQL